VGDGSSLFLRGKKNLLLSGCGMMRKREKGGRNYTQSDGRNWKRERGTDEVSALLAGDAVVGGGREDLDS